MGKTLLKCLSSAYFRTLCSCRALPPAHRFWSCIFLMGPGVEWQTNGTMSGVIHVGSFSIGPHCVVCASYMPKLNYEDNARVAGNIYDDIQ